MVRYSENRLSIIASLLLASLPLSAAEVDPRLKLVVFAGWDELEKIDDSRSAIDVTWDRKYLEGPKRKDITKGVCRYRRNGKLESIFVDTNRTDVIVRNSRYDFFITKESESSPWVARVVNLGSENQEDRQIPESMFMARYTSPTSTIIAGSFASQQRKWSSFKNDPDFVVTKISQMNNGNVLVGYKYKFATGEFECDPKYNYLACKGRSRDSDGMLSYDISFDRKASVVDDKIVVETMLYDVISDPIGVSGKIQIEAIYSYPDLSKTNELDEERFRLSYYGLPEPEGVVWEKPRNYLSYWLVGGGALVVVLATLVLRFLRKRPKEIQP